MALTQKQIQQAAVSAGINVPYYATELLNSEEDGPVLLFRLYGGRDVTVPLPPSEPDEVTARAEPVRTAGRVTAVGDLSQMTAAELKRLAALHAVTGRSRMNKAQLVEALNEALETFAPRKTGL